MEREMDDERERERERIGGESYRERWRDGDHGIEGWMDRWRGAGTQEVTHLIGSGGRMK